MSELARSYAEPNRELAESFVRYMQARSLSAATVRAYRHAVERLSEQFGPVSLVEAQRSDIHNFLARLLRRGHSDNSVHLRTEALRCFFKFLRLAGLISRDPMLQISHRKLKKRLPLVLTIADVEKLIAAARDPFERAVAELIYASGVRVSELVALRLENVDFAERTITIIKGKGGKDRYSLFGRLAERAISEYIAWRKPKTFLFEAPSRNGSITRTALGWTALAYFDGIQRYIRIGKLRDLPTKAAARKAFDKIVAEIPGFHPVGARPYQTRAIGGLLTRLSHRAKLPHVHPHSLRRAAACHLLADGADIRHVQVFLGHSTLSTTQIYTTLTNEKLQEIYGKAHPHAQSQQAITAGKD
jgi:integrase/recombinase XerC